MKVLPLTLPIPSSGLLDTTAPALCKAPCARDKHSPPLLPPSFATQRSRLGRDEHCPTAIYIWREEEEEDKEPFKPCTALGLAHHPHLGWAAAPSSSLSVEKGIHVRLNKGRAPHPWPLPLPPAPPAAGTSSDWRSKDRIVMLQGSSIPSGSLPLPGA